MLYPLSYRRPGRSETWSETRPGSPRVGPCVLSSAPCHADQPCTSRSTPVQPTGVRSGWVQAACPPLIIRASAASLTLERLLARRAARCRWTRVPTVRVPARKHREARSCRPVVDGPSPGRRSAPVPCGGRWARSGLRHRAAPSMHACVRPAPPAEARATPRCRRTAGRSLDDLLQQVVQDLSGQRSIRTSLAQVSGSVPQRMAHARPGHTEFPHGRQTPGARPENSAGSPSRPSGRSSAAEPCVTHGTSVCLRRGEAPS